MARDTHLNQRHRGLIPQDQVPTDLDANARVSVRKNSAGSVFKRRRINLIEGTGVTLTVADDSGNEEVDVTIAASGGGGGTMQWDEVGSVYQFPLGGGFDTIEQEDLGDGTDSYAYISSGVFDIETDDGAGQTAYVTADSSSPKVSMKANDGAGSFAQIDLAAGGNGQIAMYVSEAVVVNISGTSDPSRFFILGGTGLVIPSLAADPGSPVAGQMYFNTGSSKARMWDGAAWNDLW